MFSSSQPSIGYMDLFKQRKEFFANLASVSSKFESLATNWKPLLPLIKNLIIYSTEQFSVLSDPDNDDPGWKEFSAEALTAIEKIQLLVDEFSRKDVHLPQMFGYFIDLIKQIPQVIVYFNKLQLHIPLLEMIPQGEELKKNAPHLVMDRIKSKLPQYAAIETFLEESYQKFAAMNALEIFSKRTYLEKIALLTALGGFNNILKQACLALDSIAITLGIRLDVIYAQPIFMKDQLSIEQLCKQVSKFYREASAEAGFESTAKKSMYPFHQEIILQQKAMLKVLEDKILLKKRISELYQRTVTNLIDYAENTLKVIEKNDEETQRHKAFLQGFINTLNAANIFNLSLIVKALDQNANNKLFKSKKNDKIIASIKVIHAGMVTEEERMKKKEEIVRLSLDKHIGKLEAKLESKAEETKAEETNAIDPKEHEASTLAQFKAIMTEIVEQFKKISATLEARPKTIREPTPAQPSPTNESQIEKMLTLIDSQFEIMLDKNIFQQYILPNNPELEEPSVDLHGAGWIVAVGASLKKVKLAFYQYKQIALYFNSERPEIEAASVTSPRDELLVFMRKAQSMAETSQELVVSLVELASDPFVQSLMSSAGLKNIIFPQPLVAVAEEQANGESAINLAFPDSLEDILNTLANFYETLAQQHLHDKDKIKSLRDTLFRVYSLTQAYQEFKNKEKNKIQVSRMQFYAFVWRHYKDIFLLLSDVPSNIANVAVIAKKEFSLLIEQLNAGLCNFILMLNRIEIEFNLRQNYFVNSSLPDLFSLQLQEAFKLNELPDAVKTTSLHKIITDIYKKLEDFHYTFRVKYPFFGATQNQQTKIFFSTATSTLKNRYAKYFLQQTSLHENEFRSAAALVSKVKHQHYADKFNALIATKLNQLQTERSANKIILKSLLQKLTQSMNPIESLDDKINNLSLNSHDRENIYLLYQRHTRKLMTSLQQQTAKRADILNEIDDEIDKLSVKRTQYYFFFANSRRSKLEATIYAYHELRHFMARPGYKVTDFAAESPQQYALLVAHDKPLLEKLLRFSERSIYLKNEKFFAGDVLPHAEPDVSQAKLLTDKLKQTSAISTRIAQLRSQCPFSTRRKKIKLLETLEQLLQTKTLEKSLVMMQNDKSTAGDFYLLHEGKTGRMLQELRQLSKQDMLNAISLEIFRLKQSRQAVFYFSQKSRKLLLEERIQACLAYRQMLETSPADTSFDEALSLVSHQDQKILQKYETSLMDKLKAWEATNARLDTVVMLSRP